MYGRNVTDLQRFHSVRHDVSDGAAVQSGDGNVTAANVIQRQRQQQQQQQHC